MNPRPRLALFAPLAALSAAVWSIRPGLSVPAASPLSAAPLPDTEWSHTRSNTLRGSLRASTAEGMFAEAVTAFTGGAVITGWALHLDASPFVMGLVTSLPQLMQLVQVPAAWVTSCIGHRTVALWAVALSRFALLPLSLLPFLPLTSVSKQALLIVICALSAALSVLGNNGWVAWMGELVPRRVRGRFFGQRIALCTLAGTIAALLAGWLLDGTRHTALAGHALALLGLLGGLLGVVTTVLMARQHDPRPADERQRKFEPFSSDAALAPLRDASARALLRYQVSWNIAIGVAAPYFALHMLQNLKMSFVFMALHGTAVAVFRMLAAPFWGRAIDRRGSRPVLLACSFAIATLPLLWLFIRPGSLWLLWVDAVLGGIFWGGHGVAAFALPLSVAPQKGRPFYLAAFSGSAGIAFALASAVAGLAVGALPPTFTLVGLPLANLQVLFIASSVARIVAAFIGLSIHEAGSHSIASVFPLPRRSHVLAEAPARLRRGA